MKIEFALFVHSFKKAAEVEEAIKKLGITHTMRIVNSHNKRTQSNVESKTRQTITKVDVLAVTQCYASHKDWTIAQVAKATGVSTATVGRIKLGTHVLQREGAK